jgi:hypothetical protein
VAAVSLPLILRPEARAEFDEAYDCYEGQRAGLGEAFAEQVQRVLDRIVAMPRLHGIVFGDVRKAVVVRLCLLPRRALVRARPRRVSHQSRPAHLAEPRLTSTWSRKSQFT